MEKLGVEGYVARAGNAYAYRVSSVRKTKRLFTGNPTSPVKRDRFNSGGEYDIRLKSKIASGDGSGIVKIHGSRVSRIAGYRHRSLPMTPHGVGARPLNVGREFSRRIRKPKV
jgi:hypothetical protein